MGRIERRNATTLGELVDLSVEAISLLESGPVWFRGQRDVAWNLDPGVWRRTSGDDDPGGYERNLVHRFRSRAGVYGPGLKHDERAAWLQLMQHHGLPTRLLDWSRSPLIGAYFALESVLVGGDQAPPDRDPVVWVVAPHALNRLATDGTHDVTPSIESLICAGLVDGAFWGDAWAARTARAKELELGVDDGTHRLDEQTGEFVGPPCMAVMANETNLRMLMQQGAFTVHSMGSAAIDDDPRFATCLLQIVIPKERAVRMAQQLAAAGYGEAGTYPDLDHLAAELVRQAGS